MGKDFFVADLFWDRRMVMKAIMGTNRSSKYNDEILVLTAVADMFALLSILLQFPNKELVGGLQKGTVVKDITQILSELGLADQEICSIVSSFDSFSSRLTNKDTALTVLRRDYSYMFDHPDRPVVRLYESLFLEEAKKKEGKANASTLMFVNKAALDADRLYREAGMKRAHGKNIPADCMYTELEFSGHLYRKMAHSLNGGDVEAFKHSKRVATEFFDAHLNKWAVAFFEACVKKSRDMFYSSVGLLGGSFFVWLFWHAE